MITTFSSSSVQTLMQSEDPDLRRSVLVKLTIVIFNPAGMVAVFNPVVMVYVTL